MINFFFFFFRKVVVVEKAEGEAFGFEIQVRRLTVTNSSDEKFTYAVY